MNPFTRFHSKALKRLVIIWAFFRTHFLRKVFALFGLNLWQKVRRRKILWHALIRSKFYRDFYGAGFFKRWEDLPIIDKNLMMKNFDSLNTRNIHRDEALNFARQNDRSRNFSERFGNLTVGLSSGTSGAQGIFVATPFEEAQWAGAILARAISLAEAPHRIALFLRSNSPLYESLGSRLIQFRFFDILLPIREHLQTLSEYAPTTLVAPPNVLRQIAKHKADGLTTVSPKKIYSVAEVLESVDRAYIESIFDQAIGEIYQATEGFIAISCQKGRLHINEDLLLVERDYIDQKRFHPIITDFYRKTQPIIRYRLNDILHSTSDVCPCGSPYAVISKVEGRCDDIFYFYNDVEKRTPVYPDFIRNVLLNTPLAVREYKAVQKKIHHLNLQIVLEKKLSESNVEALFQESFDNFFRQVNIKPVAIEFSHFIPSDDPLKKLRRVRRDYEI